MEINFGGCKSHKDVFKKIFEEYPKISTMEIAKILEANGSDINFIKSNQTVFFNW